MRAEPLLDVLGLDPLRGSFCTMQHRLCGPPGRAFPFLAGHLAAAVPDAEQRFDLAQQFVAVATRHGVRQRGEELHVPNEVCPAELYHRVGLGEELAVNAVIIAADDARKGLAEKLVKHVGASRGIDVEPREALWTGYVKAPRPQLLAVLGMTSLVDVERRLPRQGRLQFRMAGAQRGAGLLNDLGDLARGKRQAEHIAQERPDRRVRHVAGPLLKSQQRRQTRTDQPGQPHVIRQRNGDDLARDPRAVQPRDAPSPRTTSPPTPPAAACGTRPTVPTPLPAPATRRPRPGPPAPAGRGGGHAADVPAGHRVFVSAVCRRATSASAA